MGKAGRPKKAGPRETNGQLKRPSAAERRRADQIRLLGERAYVAAQPHRRGEMSQMAGSVLGRFCLRHKLREEFYNAGQTFASTVSSWRSAKGVPVFRNISPGRTPDPEEPEITAKRVEKLRRKMVGCEKAMLDIGIEALTAVRQITLDELELTHEQVEHAKDGLAALAVELQFVPMSEHPFCGTAPVVDRRVSA